ncbi:MAG: transposase [Polyangiaceae bacterium]
MQRGQVATLARPGTKDAADEDHDQPPENKEVAVEHQGFNLHAGVRIGAGDDLGRERLARYALRPPLSLERLRRLPGGRIAYRLKYVSRDRGKHRVMTPMEFMARLSAISEAPSGATNSSPRPNRACARWRPSRRGAGGDRS